MHASTASQPKPENLFGVCAALAEDFGFNPMWLRVALGAGILWNPAAMLAIYAGLGILVLATRLLFPDRKLAGSVPQAAPRDAAPIANDDAEPALAA
jgi:phage shock protein PspC (stress-responsive transcriptional regulator)